MIGHLPLGLNMATNLVNLDALIRRDDFEITDTTLPSSQKTQTLQIRDLEPRVFFYGALRKPDFQRETANWNPVKIANFVRSFLNGDLIPSIILWQAGAGGSIFVIDGAHRLSALIAWVHDDYGDGKVSRDFFENHIPDEQARAAKKTRGSIDGSVGSYAEHTAAIQHQEKSRPDIVTRAKQLGSLAVQVQWVIGNADKAEVSFFTINQQATPIDPTELRILRCRNNPNALAARAIVRGGTGHKYWSRFSDENARKEIEAIAAEIHSNLFRPPLQTPIKTLDLPVAGNGYSSQTLPLIFDFVNLVNDVSVKEVAEDKTGAETIEYLKRVRRIVQHISGLHPSSLGLHPAVYFYSVVGRHQPTALLAAAGLVRELNQADRFPQFTKHRRRFEDFLLENKDFMNQIVRKLGSGLRGFSRALDLYRLVLNNTIAGKSKARILAILAKDQNFSFLKPSEEDSKLESNSKDFKTPVKSAAFLKEALSNPMRCKICNGLIHVNSISIDHVVRKEDGGKGNSDNSQLAHPYCNSGYKEKLHALAKGKKQ